MKLKDRIVGFERLDPSLIRPNPRNWRTHPQGQRDALRGVLADVGIVDAVLVRKTPDGSYLLVDGHLRAEEITGQPVPALILDLDEREEAEVLATFDPVGDMAGRDSDVLASLLGDFNSTNAAVQALCSRLYQPVNMAPDDGAFAREMEERRTEEAGRVGVGPEHAGGDAPPPTPPPDDGAAVIPEGNYREQYGVIVVCEDAAAQEAAYDDLQSRGYVCKVVVT